MFVSTGPSHACLALLLSCNFLQSNKIHALACIVTLDCIFNCIFASPRGQSCLVSTEIPFHACYPLTICACSRELGQTARPPHYPHLTGVVWAESLNAYTPWQLHQYIGFSDMKFRHPLTSGQGPHVPVHLLCISPSPSSRATLNKLETSSPS